MDHLRYAATGLRLAYERSSEVEEVHITVL
jgi:hypothetical protein